MSKYEVISGPYFPVFSPNTGKDGPEITLYLDTFNAVYVLEDIKFKIITDITYAQTLIAWYFTFLHKDPI